MKNIYIVGAGDFGKELVWFIKEINKHKQIYHIIGYLDDDETKLDSEFYGYPVCGKISDLEELAKENDAYAVVAMQDGRLRKKVVEAAKSFQRWETLIHPSVYIAEDVYLGKGCIVCPNVTISLSTEIQEHCLLYFNAAVGHDCKIQNYVSVMGNSTICGHVTIGEGAYLATHISIIPNIYIGAWAKVCVGSAVIHNVKEAETVFGVPAKRKE